MKASVFFDYWWKTMKFWKMKRSNKFFIEIHNELCSIAVNMANMALILFSSPLLSCKTPCATAIVWTQRHYGMYSKTNHLLTCSQQTQHLSVNGQALTYCPSTGLALTALLICHRLTQTQNVNHFYRPTALPFLHTAHTQVRIPSQGVLWSERFNFCPTHATGRSYFTIIFLPPWWI